MTRIITTLQYLQYSPVFSSLNMLPPHDGVEINKRVVPAHLLQREMRLAVVISVTCDESMNVF